MIKPTQPPSNYKESRESIVSILNKNDKLYSKLLIKKLIVYNRGQAEMHSSTTRGETKGI